MLGPCLAGVKTDFVEAASRFSEGCAAIEVLKPKPKAKKPAESKEQAEPTEQANFVFKIVQS